MKQHTSGSASGVLITVTALIVLAGVVYLLGLQKITTTANTPVEIGNPTQVYSDDVLNVRMVFPETWTLLQTEDGEPYFSVSDGVCGLPDSSPCPGFKIQDSGALLLKNGQQASKIFNSDVAFGDYKIDGLNPTRISNLIKDAKVIKANAPGSATGWSVMYEVIFEGEQRRFSILGNDADKIESILKTLELEK